MDFQHFKAAVRRDADYPPRQHELHMLARVRDGRLYEHLPHPFHQEQTDGGQYIPLRERRPSARYNLCRVVVDDAVSLLFGDGHFPAVECEDEAVRDALQALAQDTELPTAMQQAAITGSVGSVAIVMRVLSGRLFWSVMEAEFLTPTWRSDAPDTLQSVREQYKVKGQVLKAAGYAVPDDDLAVDFWFRRDFNAQAETWHLPVRVGSALSAQADWPVDEKRTTRHGLGFVPLVWVRNLPAGDPSGVDGASTFPVEAVDTMIEIDYLLSQGGRGLKYASDPTLLIREPAVDADGRMVKGPDRAIVVEEGGDAKLLEISGAASTAVMEWVKALRELAPEQAHGNRANADKLSAAQSGRAMELMNQALIWLADKLRMSYGRALLALLRMAAQASAKVELVDSLGERVPALERVPRLALRWPSWYPPTFADQQMQVAALREATGGRQVLSQETAVKSAASSFGVSDPADELRQIKADGPPPDEAAKQAGNPGGNEPPKNPEGQ